MTEVELNRILADHLRLIEEVIEVAEAEGAEKTLAFLLRKKRQTERKLYQDEYLSLS